MRPLSAAVIGVASFLMPAAASAADLLGPPPVIEYPTTPIEIGSNWYLRGDIGFKVYGTPNAHFDVVGYGDMIDETISNTGTIGAGFGYKFNRFFRVDATLDYEWPGKFHGRLPCPVPTNCASPDYSDEYADISAWTGLINAYFDLATFGRITPYVGAGIGFSAITASNVHFINPDDSTGRWGSATTLNLAWALMAGTAINLNHYWAIDFNYRYLHLGNAQSAGTLPQFNDEPERYDDIAAQEIRVGFRYNIH